jgi:ferredoxin
LGVPIINLKEKGFSEVPIRGAVLDRAYIARPVLEADFLVNLPKLKTHSFTIFTGAVKNMYGVIPLGLRHQLHRRFSRNDAFSRMLVDLYAAVPPRLTIMDAVVGMDGEGPSAGRPRAIGLILAGFDGVAVDAVATRVAGYDPGAIFTTAFAGESGIGVADLRLIDVAGEPPQEVAVEDFRPSAAAVKLFRRKIPSLLYALFQSELVLIPEVRPDVCTACQECVRICPSGAVHLAGEAALVDERKCIHCLCCHEACPDRAIRLKQLALGRMIRTASGAYGKLKSLLRRAGGPWGNSIR